MFYVHHVQVDYLTGCTKGKTVVFRYFYDLTGPKKLMLMTAIFVVSWLLVSQQRISLKLCSTT